MFKIVKKKTQCKLKLEIEIEIWFDKRKKNKGLKWAIINQLKYIKIRYTVFTR